MAEKFKSGFVAIVGRPNAGKSTLVNHLVGEKVAIVTSRPQTTRNRIQGIVNREHAQIVMIDTPGLHRPESALDLRDRALADQPRVESKMDLRNYGIGAQILRDLNVGKMRLLARPRKMPSMAGFDLAVTGYEEFPPRAASS